MHELTLIYNISRRSQNALGDPQGPDRKETPLLPWSHAPKISEILKLPKFESI